MRLRLRESFMLVILGCALGCGGAETPDANSGADKSAAPSSSPVVAGKETPKDVLKPAVATTVPENESFKKATFADAPDGELPPPDLTMSGKNTAKIYESIAGKDGKPGLWDEVAFVSPDGKKLRHFAHVKTDLGDITIELFSTEAPRHVRNFIALARAGYYDGLCFHRSERTEGDEKKGSKLFHYLEAGCPKGTGQIGYGSIGYWLLPEINDKLTHVPGTVGAWHSIEVESAACKFYFTLTPAPWMDGLYTIFGRITSGLDVANAISARPMRKDMLGPQEPVVIRSVIISSEVKTVE